jgi:hypothetical protein
MSTQIITPEWREQGVQRLLSSPRDLLSCGARIVIASASASGSTRHAALFQQYLEALREVIPEACRVWLAIIDQCQKSIPERGKAMLAALRFQPAGAAFDGRIVGVVRDFWLACDRTNQEVDEHERVSPEVFLLEWLIAARSADAVDVIAGMPYWPIGLDSAGNWV